MAEVGRARSGSGAPVRPPRKGTSPGPAAAPAATRPRRSRDRWLWPLVAVVALVGVVIIASIVTSEPSGSGPLSSAPTTAPVTVPPHETSRDDEDGPPPGWSEVARGFGLAFTRTALGQDAWYAAMSTWLTREQADLYRDVPIEDIPTGTLEEVAVQDPGGGHAARGRLTYDTGMVLEVGLSYEAPAGGWLVARVTLADQGS